MSRRANRPRSGKTTWHRDETVTLWDSIDEMWIRGKSQSILVRHPGIVWLASSDLHRLVARMEGN